MHAAGRVAGGCPGASPRASRRRHSSGEVRRDGRCYKDTVPAVLDRSVARGGFMSGHNRWTKIKRKKEAMGATKGTAFTKISKEITVSARIGGGDPAGNFRRCGRRR